MSVTYFAGFMVNEIPAWSITLTPNGGGSPIVIDASDFDGSTLKLGQAHGYLTGFGSLTHISGVGAAVPVAKWQSTLFGVSLGAVAAAASGWTVPSVIGFGFSTTTMRYTVSSDADTFALSFTGIGAALLGFSADQSAAATHVGTLTPYYVIRALSNGMSADSGETEAEDVSSLAVSDNTYHSVGQSRTAAPIHRDWEQRFESLVTSRATSSGTPDPWTWEHFFRHCRTKYPFVVFSTVSNSRRICMLRKEGSSFRPRVESEGNADQIHIPIKAWVRGY